MWCRAVFEGVTECYRDGRGGAIQIDFRDVSDVGCGGCRADLVVHGQSSDIFAGENSLLSPCNKVGAERIGFEGISVCGSLHG